MPDAYSPWGQPVYANDQPVQPTQPVSGLWDHIANALTGAYGKMMMGAGQPQAFGTETPQEVQPHPLAPIFANAAASVASLPQRAIQNSQNSLDSGNYNPAPVVEAAMLPMGTGAIAGVPVRAGEAVLGAGPIRAYHGSPHDFDRFDLSKIGTGEGAQAYGHGLYFADAEATARAYRDKLSPGSHSRAIDEALGNDTSAYPGRMYEVNINADPAHFLDWDKPLSAQPKSARELLTAEVDRAHREGYTNFGAKDATGGDAYGAVAGLQPWSRGPRTDYMATSNALREAGIPGIKYLDQGSRAAGDGSRNYVVFDDKLIDIMRKYGFAIPGAAGAAAATLPTYNENSL